jgi:hypothetical protein
MGWRTMRGRGGTGGGGGGGGGGFNSGWVEGLGAHFEYCFDSWIFSHRFAGLWALSIVLM